MRPGSPFNPLILVFLALAIAPTIARAEIIYTGRTYHTRGLFFAGSANPAIPGTPPCAPWDTHRPNSVTAIDEGMHLTELADNPQQVFSRGEWRTVTRDTLHRLRFEADAGVFGASCLPQNLLYAELELVHASTFIVTDPLDASILVSLAHDRPALASPSTMGISSIAAVNLTGPGVGLYLGTPQSSPPEGALDGAAADFAFNHLLPPGEYTLTMYLGVVLRPGINFDPGETLSAFAHASFEIENPAPGSAGAVALLALSALKRRRRRRG